MNEKICYNFFGIVHPERANVTISRIGMILNLPEVGIVDVEVSSTITCSQISVSAYSLTKIEDVPSLKNYIEDAIRIEVDVLGYLNGCGYSIEIIQMIDSLGSPPVIFGVDIPILRPALESDFTLAFSEIIDLFRDYKSDALRRSLADFREAIRNPKDTAFFCFRSIESLRHFFISEKNAKDKKQSWECLREELGIEKSEIEAIQVFADPIRHGDTRYISGAQRAEVYTITKAMIEKFIAYAKNGYSKP